MYLNKMNTIYPLSWSCQSNLHLRSAMKNTNTPLDGAYLADFGIDIGFVQFAAVEKIMLK